MKALGQSALRFLRREAPGWSFFGVTALGFVIMVLLICLTPKSFFYDEPHYLNNVGYLHQYGFGSESLREFPGYAGPLHTWLHYFLEPLTNLQVLPTRLVNIVLAIGSIFVLGILFRGRGPRSFSYAAALLAFPPIWPLCGLALTEMISILFMSIGLVFLFSEKTGNSLRMVGGALLGGVCFSLAIAGRQTLLPICLIPLGLFLLSPGARLRPGLFLLASLPLPLWVLFTWQGMRPPMIQAMFEARGQRGDLVPFHAVLSYGYTFVLCLLVAPAYLRLKKAFLIGVIFLGGLTYFVVQPRPHLPGKSLFQTFLPDSLLSFGGHLFPFVVCVFAAWFVAATAFRALTSDHLRSRLPLALAAGLVLGAPIAINHIFSSRYTAIAAPLLLLLLYPFWKPNYASLIRLAVAVMAGGMILHSWFFDDNRGYAAVKYIHIQYPHLFEDSERFRWEDESWRDVYRSIQAGETLEAEPVPISE